MYHIAVVIPVRFSVCLFRVLAAHAGMTAQRKKRSNNKKQGFCVALSFFSCCENGATDDEEYISLDACIERSSAPSVQSGECQRMTVSIRHAIGMIVFSKSAKI